MRSFQTKYRFPARKGNRYRLLTDGRAFFPAMLEAIAGAQQSILLLMYLCESGQVTQSFSDALIAAAGRGVRTCLLLDDFGSYLLRRGDRQRLLDGGIELVFCNPLRVGRWNRNLARDHRKILIVDGQVAFTGGAGLTDNFDPAIIPDLYWHDLMLEVRGPCVRDWHALFQESWEQWAGRPLPVSEPEPGFFPDGHSGRVTVQMRARTGSRGEVLRSLVRRVRGARQRVFLVTPYFLPTWKLRRDLRRRARTGTEVRLLLPGPHTDNPPVRTLGRRYYEKLLRDGVRLFEYQPRFLHAKVFLCDHWLSIGSTNLDRWGYRWNLDANQELEDPQVLAQIVELFESDLGASQEVRYEEWLRRSRAGRLAERFWGWVLTVAVWASERLSGWAGSGRRS